MESIMFAGIAEERAETMKRAFSLFADGKRSNHIDHAQIAEALGDLYETGFLHTKEDSNAWLARWRANPEIELPWDYGSWIDAIMNAELDLEGIVIEQDGTGRISFNQLAWPLWNRRRSTLLRCQPPMRIAS